MEISVRLHIFKPYCRSLVLVGLYKTWYCCKPSFCLPFLKQDWTFYQIDNKGVFYLLDLVLLFYFSAVCLHPAGCGGHDSPGERMLFTGGIQGVAGWLRHFSFGLGAILFLPLFWLGYLLGYLLPRRTSPLSIQILTPLSTQVAKQVFTGNVAWCLRKDGVGRREIEVKRQRDLQKIAFLSDYKFYDTFPLSIIFVHKLKKTFSENNLTLINLYQEASSSCCSTIRLAR